MRTLKLSLFASAMLLGSFTMTAQSADDVMNKHIAAVGGADSWKKITSLKKVGTVSIQGNEAKVTLNQVQNKAFRMDLDFDMQGTVINNYVIFTATEGWQFFPIGGQTEPQAMPAEQLASTKEALDLTDEVILLKQKGTKATYVGKEKVDGKDCHKVTVADADGDITMYFDATTNFLTKKTEMAEVQPGQKAEVVSTYLNYKKLPEGISVPMSGADPNFGEMTFTSVEANKTIEDSVFKPAK